MSEKASNNSKSRNYVFTIFNVGEDESDVLGRLYEEGFCNNIFFTHELGENKKTPHIQGFLSCSSSRKLLTVKNKINGLFKNAPNPHVEKANGSAYQNYVYITKELKENPLLKHRIYGNRPLPPGKKRDDSKFESYVNLLEKGEIRLRDIEREDLAHYQRHESFYLGVYSKLMRRGIKPPMFVSWFSGPSGSGKSFTAEAIAEALNFDIYEVTCDNGFFGNYGGEELALWNDYRAGCVSFHTLLRITDRKGSMINVKGSKVFFCPRIQIFTSPDGIESVKTYEMEYMNSRTRRLDYKFQQLLRRVSYVVDFKLSNDDSVPTFKEVKRNSEKVVKRFLGVYKYFLIDNGFEEYVKLLPALTDVEPIKINTKLVKEDEECKVYTVDNAVSGYEHAL